MIWSLLQNIGSQIINFTFFFVLAFYLESTDFGTLGIGLVIINFLKMFSEMGFGAALIQKNNVSNAEFSSVFYLNIVIGLLSFIFMLLIALYVKIILGLIDLYYMIIILSFGFLINAPGITYNTITNKKLNFKKLAIRDLLAYSIGGCAGLLLAINDFGVISLGFQYVTILLVKSIFIINTTKWRPSISLVSTAQVRGLSSFSIKIFLFDIVKTAGQNIDKLIISAVLGVQALGAYVFSYRSVIYSTNIVYGSVGLYLFPKFSSDEMKLKNIKRFYLSILNISNITAGVFSLIILLFSRTAIEYFYGDKWTISISIIQSMTLLSLLTPFFSFTGQLFKSLNKPKILVKWSIYQSALIILIIYYFSLNYGLKYLGIGLSLSYLVTTPMFYIKMNKILSLSINENIKLFAPILCFILFFLIFYVCNYFGQLNNIPFILLSATIMLLFISFQRGNKIFDYITDLRFVISKI